MNDIKKIFVDTSVFGGCFDEEYKTQSERFFSQVKKKQISILISPTIIDEINRAPTNVQKVLTEIPPQQVELIKITKEIEQLRDAYLGEKVLGKSSFNDAEHIAAATVARADLIASWNFKHIVNFNKIKGFHSINLLFGYSLIAIHSPMEVFSD